MTVAGKTTGNGLANNSINTIPEFTVPTVQRISYVLPNVERPPRYFALPTLSQASEGPAYVRSGPLLLPHPEDEALLSGTRSLNSPSTSHPLHSLPICSLAIDTSTIVQNGDRSASSNAPEGILYAGGRDGMISAWDLALPMRKRRRNNRTQHGEFTEYDEEATAGLLDDHRGQSGSRFGRYHSYSSPKEWEVDTTGLYDGHAKIRPASFRQCIGSHTDWVNELLLCNQNQTVVSASSDGNVNIWNPHDTQSSMTPQILGTHKDYVRALTLAKNANWVASGSFDKTIKLWDIGEVRHSPIITLPESSVKSSIYTLSTNNTGTVIAGGSPERVIRVWDPRSGDQVSQLVGHTDTVRKVVMSEDGSHMLSASSDSTIKLWSLGEQRCLHTFTHHTDSVWSLFSDHPRLDIFYSGDRSGLICKVDWERCNEVSEGECVLLAKDADVDTEYKFASESNASGIHSLVSTDDSFVWSANANGKINRWLDIASKSAREAIYPLVQPAPLSKKGPLQESASSPPNPRISALRGASGNIVPSTSNVSFADPFGSSPSIKSSVMHSPDVDQELTQTASSSVDKLYGIPFDSLVCLAPPNDPYGAAIGLGSISMRATSQAATPHETDTIFTSASLISIPSVLRQQSQVQTNAGRSEEQSYDTAPNASMQQQQHQQYTNCNSQSQSYISNATSPPMGYPFSSHLRETNARPSSVRSGSLRFAPTTTQHSYPDGLEGDDDHFEDDENENEAALEARLAFEERELAIDAVPLRESPQDVIHGTHGLIRSTLLNDRRHCLTIDAAGLTYLWDIVAGQCLGAYTWSDLKNAAEEADLRTELLPGDALDIIKGRIQGHSAAPIWCTVDTKIGALSVHLEHPRCFDSEIYLDESEELFHHSDPYFAYKEDQRVNKGRMILKNLFAGFVQQETRLRSDKNAILSNALLALERKDEVERSLKEGDKEGLSVNGTDAAGRRIALAIGPKTPAIVPVQSPLSPTNTHHLSELQRLMLIKHANQGSNAGTHGSAIGDYFSIQRATDQPGSAAQTPTVSKSAESPVTPGISAVSPGSGGFMGKFRMGLRREGTVSKKPPKTPTGAGKHELHSTSKENENGIPNGLNDNNDGLTQETRQQLHTLRTILASISSTNQQKDAANKPTVNPTTPGSQSDFVTTFAPRQKWMEEIPIIQYSPGTALIISESAHDSGSFQTKYRGLVGKTQEDIVTLELQSPAWLLENLFDYKDASGVASYDVLREKDKLTFILVPWEGASTQSLSSSQVTAEKDTAAPLSEDSIKNKLPAMPTGNSRLTATRMLRAKKACAYVADKLHLIEISQDEENKAGGSGYGNTSGFSSIVASRRPSAIVTEVPPPMPGTSHPPLSPSASASQASPVQSNNPFTKAFSMAKGGLNSNGFSQSARSTQGTGATMQAAQNLQLRRPSAISMASSGGGNSLKSVGWVMPYGSSPQDYLELLCKDQVIHPTMTLAQIHRFIWKSGAAIKLEYRWRSGITLIDTEEEERREN